jgi:hypothetical protein
VLGRVIGTVRRLAAAGLLVAVAASSMQSPAGSASPTDAAGRFPASPPGAPITPAWLSAMSRALTPVHPARVVLAPMDASLSYDNMYLPGVTTAVERADLRMVESTGAPAVAIDLGFQPWLTGDTATIAEDDRMIARIRASGRLLVLKDAASETYRAHPLPWRQFEAAWVQRVRTLAARYHPAYYTVIKEPGWYLPMIAGLSPTLHSPADARILEPSTWIALLQRLVSAVHSVSPSTRVGVAIPGDSLYHGAVPVFPKFMDEVSETPGVAFLGFDIYDTTAFTDTLRYLRTNDIHGRAVWVNEAWSTPTLSTATDPARASLDAQWMQLLYRFALYIHAQGVVPFWTDFFASYAAQPSTTAGYLRYYSGRTPVFGAFTSVVKDERAGRV